jgi:hypothetical protein
MNATQKRFLPITSSDTETHPISRLLVDTSKDTQGGKG